MALMAPWFPHEAMVISSTRRGPAEPSPGGEQSHEKRQGGSRGAPWPSIKDDP